MYCVVPLPNPRRNVWANTCRAASTIGWEIVSLLSLLLLLLWLWWVPARRFANRCTCVPVKSKCTTVPLECTPASVRPCNTTATTSLACATMEDSLCWTCAWMVLGCCGSVARPWKYCPSYERIMAKRMVQGLARLLPLLLLLLLLLSSLP